MPVKLNVDVTAVDTTQARVTLQDVIKIKNSHFRIWHACTTVWPENVM